MKKKLYCVCLLTLLILSGLFLWSTPSPSKYVWCMGFARACDVTFHKSKEKDPSDYIQVEKIKAGDLVWIKAAYLTKFSQDFLPHIQSPFVLVITEGDETFPETHAETMDVEALIRNEKILHIFAQNCIYAGPHRPKVTPLPIGIDLHTLAKNRHAFKEGKTLSSQEQERILEKIVSQLKPTSARKKRALIDFHLHDTLRDGGRCWKVGEDRRAILQKIALSGVIDVLEAPIPRRELWRRKGEYAFSIAPQGNGMDTHRLWEDLILGCIVIVKTSLLDPLYKGLPVVIIQEWSEITTENLDKWHVQYADAFTNPEYRKRLTHTYWQKQISSYKRLPKTRFSEKLLICGICKNVEKALPFCIAAIEQVGAQFRDYRVFIYENNSSDRTPQLLHAWSGANPHVTVTTENIPQKILRALSFSHTKENNPYRAEVIARARNHVLRQALSPKWDDYTYVMMVDMDFEHPWNVEGIIDSFLQKTPWDALCANGVDHRGRFYDRYALRSEQFPLGPEILGDSWWTQIEKERIKFKKEQPLIPVYSAFGGLAIYRRSSIKDCYYSGAVNAALDTFTQRLLDTHPHHPHVLAYHQQTRLTLQFVPGGTRWTLNSGGFPMPVCCEHVPFHASMILHGHDKIFINPRMTMLYGAGSR